jgi:hypothetical protein
MARTGQRIEPGSEGVGLNVVEAEHGPVLWRLHEPLSTLYANFLGLGYEVAAVEGDAHTGRY